MHIITEDHHVFFAPYAYTVIEDCVVAAIVLQKV